MSVHTKSSKGPATRTLPKKTPKSLDERTTTLFASLCAQIDGGHHDKALKTCDRILRLVPDDADVLETKAYLLIQLELYEPALQLATTDSKHNGLGFHQAYCLYRSQREGEALGILQELRSIGGIDQRGIEHLQAQSRYRETSYDSCRVLYQALLDTGSLDSDEREDVLNNLKAAQIHLDFLGGGYQDSVHGLPISLPKLEASPPPLPSSAASIPTTHGLSSHTAARRKRQPRIPPDVELGVTPLPDPERWVKKRDRTRELRKAKKGKKEGMGAGATQGVAVGTPPTSASRTNQSGSTPGKKKRHPK